MRFFIPSFSILLCPRPLCQGLPYGVSLRLPLDTNCQLKQYSQGRKGVEIFEHSEKILPRTLDYVIINKLLKEGEQDVFSCFPLCLTASDLKFLQGCGELFSKSYPTLLLTGNIENDKLSISLGDNSIKLSCCRLSLILFFKSA